MSWALLAIRFFTPSGAALVLNSITVHKLQPDICVYMPAFADKLQALGHNVAISHSAGRYLCNYVYFRSLQLCSNVPNWHALFVHVPPLEVIGQDAEMAFAVDLFTLLQQKVQATVPAAGLVTGRTGTLELSAA